MTSFWRMSEYAFRKKDYSRAVSFGNIVMWEPVKHLRINYVPQMCGENKLTGEMVVILLREEWISLFGHGTFQRHVLMFSTWFVRTLRNGLSQKTWSLFLFAQHLEAYLIGLWWTCLRYDNFFLMLETEKSISEIDSHHTLQEASELWSCT